MSVVRRGWPAGRAGTMRVVACLPGLATRGSQSASWSLKSCGEAKLRPSAILSGDGLACGAESAFAIGELGFGGLAALLRLAYYAAQFVDLCSGCEWHHDLITSFLCRAASLGCAYR